MKVLSLFDGISCARVALERAGIPVDFYYSSEIDKYANEISHKNYPNTIRLGNVISVTSESVFDTIDLLIGGSPCQDLSIAKRNRQGLSGERSGLFWEYVRILREVKPKWFILENVASMPKEAKETISKELGVEPIMINASLVSAQNRKRLFWTNIPNVTLPEDKGILLKDILEKEIDKKYLIGKDFKLGLKQGNRFKDTSGKSYTLSALGGGGGAKTGLYATQLNMSKRFGNAVSNRGKAFTIRASNPNGVIQDMVIRKLTPIECERLQGLPDNYTEGVSNTQRYKMLGNAFNVDVVAHILSFIPKEC